MPRAIEVLDSIDSEGLAVSIVSLGEVFEGAWKSPDPAEHMRNVHILISEYAVLGLTEPIMETFARTPAQLRQQGQLIPDLDLLIAATAVTFDMTLITRNRRHFDRVPGLTLYPRQVPYG